MYLIKRNGEKQRLDMNKVHSRIKFLVNPGNDSKQEYSMFDLSSLSPLDKIDIDGFSIKIVGNIVDNMKTSDLDRYAAVEAFYRATEHPQYEDLAVRLSIGNIQKNIQQLSNSKYLYRASCRMLAFNKTDDGEPNPLISNNILQFVEKYYNLLEDIIDYSRDYNFSYNGISLLEKKYLSRALINGSRQVVECPQHMIMRVALGIHVFNQDTPDWDSVANDIKETYRICSMGLATHATPTLFNAGRMNQQLSSCVLMGYPDDSIEGIFEYLGKKAKVIKYACGVGSWAHNIRARGTYISGTNGYSNGLTSFLRISNEVSVSIDQGGGKRPGSDAQYLELWHADIEDFLDLKLPTGNPKLRANDLFYALWICDEFVRCLLEEKRLESLGIKKKLWYLVCPKKCPDLYNKYDRVMRQSYITDEELENSGDKFEFTKLYRKYIREGKYNKLVSANELFKQISHITQEASIPYRCFKDHGNRLSNHKHLGTIKSSNLCAEIYQYTDENEIAVCNLASICVNKFVRDGYYDYEELGKTVYQITINLDKAIDVNWYPLEEMRVSNMRHRPMGIGMQGLADAFSAMGYRFGSPEALELDFHISETIYYWSLRASCDLAKKYGTYESYKGSPTSQGLFKMDLCREVFEESDLDGVEYNPIKYEYIQDWDYLRKKIDKHGLRNSLRKADMPTGSTSTIMGNSPSIEPFNSIIYKRSDSSGDGLKYNKEFINALIEKGLWNKNILEEILQSPTGSIQHLDLPQDIKDRFVIAWDDGILKSIIDHASVRNPFVDQGQSMNLFIKDMNTMILSKVFIYAWRRMLPTGSYYIRTLSKLQGKRNVSENLMELKAPKNVICTEDECIVCGA